MVIDFCGRDVFGIVCFECYDVVAIDGQNDARVAKSSSADAENRERFWLIALWQVKIFGQAVRSFDTVAPFAADFADGSEGLDEECGGVDAVIDADNFVVFAAMGVVAVLPSKFLGLV